MTEEAKNPWKTLSTKFVYENPWIHVREDQVLNPGGNEGIYGVVSFKNYAIGIIPLDEDLNTYLVGQYRYPLNIYSWEIPMGGGLKKEIPLDAAKRELQEETGLYASEWKEIMTIHTSNSVTDEIGFIFLAKNLIIGEATPEETEELKIKKVSLKTAYEMVMNGKITDSISIAGILKTWLLYN